MNRRRGTRTLVVVQCSCHVAGPLDKKKKVVLLLLQGIVLPAGSAEKSVPIWWTPGADGAGWRNRPGQISGLHVQETVESKEVIIH